MFNSYLEPNKEKVFDWLFMLAVFATAFIIRIIKVDSFINTDGAAYWFVRSQNFYTALLNLDFANTVIVIPYTSINVNLGNFNFLYDLSVTHPGVTLMILSGFSMILFNLIIGGPALNFLVSQSKLIFWAKLPIVIVTSITTALIYFLVKKITNSRLLASLSSIFVLFDSFFIAHSRYFQLDGLYVSFLIIALLLFFIFIKEQQKKYLYLSSIFCALTFLTRVQTVILVAFFLIFLSTANYFYETKLSKKEIIRNIIVFILIFVLTIFILWPASWSAPVKTATTLFNSIVMGASIPHEHLNLNPTPWLVEKLFYPFELIFRTPIAVLCLLALAIFSIIKNRLKRVINSNENFYIYLFLFILFYLMAIIIAKKEQARYLLPVFLIIDLVAAYGFYLLIKFITKIKNYKIKFSLVILISIILVSQIFFIISYHPYYSFYHNFAFWKLKDSTISNSNIYLFGWGEGQEHAIDYLNKKVNSHDLVLADFYGSISEIFFNGEVVLFNENWGKSDYLLIYQSVEKRRLFPEIFTIIENKKIEPEYTYNFKGVDLVKLYKTSELIN